MKHTKGFTSPTVQLFGQLKTGDVFRYAEDTAGYFWIKLDNRGAVQLTQDGAGAYYHPTQCPAGDRVVLVESNLVIEREY